jgi:hypothetical protein
MSRSRGMTIAVLAAAVLVLASCAAGPNAAIGAGADQAGFWLGLWHGIIAPITFLISLFTDDVNVYEVSNNGNWYDFGFVLGLSMAFGGSAGSGSAAARRGRSRAGAS